MTDLEKNNRSVEVGEKKDDSCKNEGQKEEKTQNEIEVWAEGQVEGNNEEQRGRKAAKQENKIFERKKDLEDRKKEGRDDGYI